jgi:imidazoleglycerol phosphate dehydratase HisB
MSRTGTIHRATNETSIDLSIQLDGSGDTEVSTGIPFYDHMLDQLGRHSGFDLNVQAVGDLQIDTHHTVEDVAIALGEAFREALGDKRGIRRYGFFMLPMEESLAHVAVDLSGRAAIAYRVKYRGAKIGTFVWLRMRRRSCMAGTRFEIALITTRSKFAAFARMNDSSRALTISTPLLAMWSSIALTAGSPAPARST